MTEENGGGLKGPRVVVYTLRHDGSHPLTDPQILGNIRAETALAHKVLEC